MGPSLANNLVDRGGIETLKLHFASRGGEVRAVIGESPSNRMGEGGVRSEVDIGDHFQKRDKLLDMHDSKVVLGVKMETQKSFTWL